MSLWEMSLTEKFSEMEGKVTEEYVIEVSCMVIDAIQQVHSQGNYLWINLLGILHCDIKPENIMFSKNGQIQLIDFAYSRFLNEIKKETEANTRNIFEGTIYYSARIHQSKVWLAHSIDSNGEYPSHSLIKHDLESVIYVMSSMWGYQLPWDAELIGEELVDLDDYFAFKSKITDKEIIDLIPSWMIRAFKYVMRMPENASPNYDDIKLFLQQSVDASPWAIDRMNGREPFLADHLVFSHPGDESCRARNMLNYQFSDKQKESDWYCSGKESRFCK